MIDGLRDIDSNAAWAAHARVRLGDARSRAVYLTYNYIAVALAVTPAPPLAALDTRHAAWRFGPIPRP